jgi:hypothetical protein
LLVAVLATIPGPPSVACWAEPSPSRDDVTAVDEEQRRVHMEIGHGLVPFVEEAGVLP